MMDLVAKMAVLLTISIVVLVASFLPPFNNRFKRLKGYFKSGDVALKRILYLEGVLSSLAIGVAFFGLAAAQALNNSIWSWVVGFTCLFLSAGLLALRYTGPLYKLFAELEDAETSAKRSNKIHSSNQGS
ncbi:hypothetical protein [Candidatus Phycosocius spiralis]|uniref:Uncharacterized protein n=1 Tax=Candidatus Phycosocius spiralis TaxID=2815099 RepID=A0ABQ4PW57_9PROT|nr:hypothetical protein [Candidatus Phycosocius spiralis]GIU67290.1 hypothetical protein PsB1_1444 [Candidatus Phycosocius spiralis]